MPPKWLADLRDVLILPNVAVQALAALPRVPAASTLELVGEEALGAGPQMATPRPPPRPS